MVRPLHVWRQQKCHHHEFKDTAFDAFGKGHNMLSYHRYSQAIAAGISKMLHMDGKQNPRSDVMTKFLAHSVSYILWSKVPSLLEGIYRRCGA
jgi:hypothetical protein